MSSTLNHFQESIRQQIVDTLTITPHNGRVSDKRIDKIVCIHCNQPEAWTFVDDPFTVHCNRNNNCGISDHVKVYTPKLFEKFPKSDDANPLATATAYLQSRGIDTNLIAGQYGQGSVDGFDTVSVNPSCSKDKAWHLCIGRQSKGKVKWDTGAKYAGKAYTTDSDFSQADEIWIVEGPINLWSLQQVGFTSAATMDTGNIPTDFYTSLLRDKTIVLAFDSDRAGETAIHKNKEKLLELGFSKVQVAIPPEGKEWTDLLLEGTLGEQSIEKTTSEAKFRGHLFMAATPQSYADALWDHEDPPPVKQIFEFKNGIYQAINRDDGKPMINQIADAGMNIKFVQISENGDHSITLELRHQQKTHLVDMKVEDLLSASFSEVIARKTRAWVSRTQTHLPSLYKYLNRGVHPEIRDTGAYGFDLGSRHRKGTGWYTFHGFAIDPQGRLIFPDKDGAFFRIGSNQYIRGESQFRAAIKKLSSEQYPVQNFITEIYQAFGGRGLLALGFWFASLFQHPIREAFGFFPFLSLFGDPSAGKSTLGIILNRALSFADWEGIPMNRTNTLKGPQRIIASQSSVAVPLLEWTPKSRITEEDLLNLYGGNPQQVKAERTPDSYVEVPFRCSLVIITNTEPFSLRQVKERIISLKFTKEQLTDVSQEAAFKLKNSKPEILATVGIQLLQDRQYFESSIVDEVNEVIKVLEKNGVNDRRIADNHGIALGGLSLLLQRTNPLAGEQIDEYFKEALDVCLKSASNKILSAQTDFAYADDVLEKIDEEANGDRKGTHPFARYVEGRIVVRMGDALDGLSFPKHLHGAVKEELKRHERYIDHHRALKVFGSQRQKVWEFNQKMD